MNIGSKYEFYGSLHLALFNVLLLNSFLLNLLVEKRQPVASNEFKSNLVVYKLDYELFTLFQVNECEIMSL